MNIKDFVVLPGSKAGTSVRLKAKNVRELQLEKVQLELENKEMEKKLRQLQSNMNREKEERKKSRAFHWRNGQAGPMTIHTRVLSQKQENSNKVSSGKVKLKILKEKIQEPVKQSFKGEVAKAVASETCEMKGTPYGQCETNSALLPSESIRTGLEKQETGLLLGGTFNEEESTRSFQEALMQWRNRYCDHKTALNSSEVLSESVGVCEVQTHLTLMKEPIQVEFKADSLSYMEKLLLKKRRRTPVNQVSSNQVNDLRPVQTLNEHQAAVIGGGGGGKGDDNDDDDDDDDYSAVEDMKRYWAALFREKEPNTISERVESSLKIEILDDSYDKDLDQSSNFSVMEAEAMGMNKQRKTEPLKQSGSGAETSDQRSTVRDLLPTEIVGVTGKSFGHLNSTADTQCLLPLLDRNPIFPTEISQEKSVFCNCLERNVVPKESIKIKTVGGMLSCKLSEKISNPAKPVSNKYLFETQLWEDRLDSACNSQSSVLLQEIAQRDKCVSTWNWGLEGFFVLGVNPKQGMLKASSSICAESNAADISFSGDGKWAIDRGLSEYADDSVVQGVLENQLNRSSNFLEGQNLPNRMSPLMAAHPGNDSRRPWSTTTLYYKLSGNCPASTRPRPRSSPVHPVRGVNETSRDKCLVDEHEEDVLGEGADQETLLTLERELQSYTRNNQEKICSLTSEDFHSTNFHKKIELKDHSRVDTLRGWDEGQMDDEEEEILKDKQQVLALQ